MRTIKVFDLLRKRALITRESAGALGEALAAAPNEAEVALDFTGVEAVTPSFVDEVLRLVEEALAREGRAEFRVMFLYPPTRLSSKFAAVGRARQARIVEESDGAWVITGGFARSV